MNSSNRLEDFAVFILTHGRADNVITLKTLNACGYTGRIFFIVDNEDKQIAKYKANFGNSSVIVFDKKAMADEVDEGNNFDERRTITHARNASFKIASQLGIKYFMQLDDDYMDFQFRYTNVDNDKLLVNSILSLDAVISSYLAFYKSCPNISSLAFAQGGDFIGGVGSPIIRHGKPLLRKCMNSFICSTDRPFQFIGAMNEDVNTYTTLGSRGVLFLTAPLVQLVQKQTQSQAGGITDMYLKYGTYCKSFTTVMMQPSSVYVSMMQTSHSRLHHAIKWRYTVPRILSEKHKK